MYFDYAECVQHTMKSAPIIIYSHTNVFKYEHIAYALILILIIGEYYGTL